jgi:hypothetical protein
MDQGDNLPKVGRPLADIDVEKLRQMARMGCSQSEIAQFFRVDRSTISRRFATEYEQARAECKIFIRRNQMKRAEEGSDAMLIHLGKHLLGQREKSKVAVKAGVVGIDGAPVVPSSIRVEFVNATEGSDQDPTA